jgi:ElaA protein
MSPGTRWTCETLSELSPRALYRLLRARQEVFVVEQQCAYLDADGLDEHGWHLAAWMQDDLRTVDSITTTPTMTSTTPSTPRPADPGVVVAAARLLPPGLRHAEAVIGRVLTVGAGRGVGLGDELMKRAMHECATRWPGQAVRISAQARLQHWYARLGFCAVGDPYDEDGIAHQAMRWPSAAAPL